MLSQKYIYMLMYQKISDNLQSHFDHVVDVTQKLFHPESELERRRQSFTAVALVSAMGN